MTTITEDDFIVSIQKALQHIACYHSPDFIAAMAKAYGAEKSSAARDAIAQILTNSKLCAQNRRPICQDTGIVVAFVDIGKEVTFVGEKTIEEMVNEGVRRAYCDPDNPLRASILADPAGDRINTGDNSPAVVHMRLVPGNRVDVHIAAKGGGSENKTAFAMLKPADSVADWAVETLSKMGSGWCPPGIVGLGIGGTPEKAMLMAKWSLMAPIDIEALIARGPSNRIEALRLELFDRFNQLGIGAQGLGGLKTVLDVKVLDYPTHAASLPVAMIPNCAATRHLHFILDGSGPIDLQPPPLTAWPDIDWHPSSSARRINLDALTPEIVASWQAGETLLLSGKLLTARDAAHKKIVELIEEGKPLPDGLDLNQRAIYYVGPIRPVRDEIVGPAGPTTATRMDPFTPTLLEKTGLLVMIGKAERSPSIIEAIAKHGATYLIAVGGAAYLVSKTIQSSRIVAFAELGMEAVYEFEVKDMPVTVAIDSRGEAIHVDGPKHWHTITSHLKAH